MLPHELANFPYLSPDCSIFPNIPSNYFNLENNLNPSTNTNFQLNRFLTPNSLIPLPHEFTTTHSSSTLTNNSTSDDANNEQRRRILDERKQKRVISNRESARRSRMRKQKHLDALDLAVLRLRNENHILLDKLYHVSESYDLVLQENSLIKEEVSDLRQMLSDLKASTLKDDDDYLVEEIIPCNTQY